MPILKTLSMIKQFQVFILFFLLFSFSNAANAQQQPAEVCYNPNLVKDIGKKSIKSMAFAIIKGDSLKINYHSPGVRNRVVWGGLVPYGEVWVTGAHDATTIELPGSVIINGKEISAGKYAFFTIPGKKEWTLILNKQWKQHLATEYDQNDDLVRIKVKPKKVKHTERLQYFVQYGKGNNGTIAVAWETLRLEFPFVVK